MASRSILELTISSAMVADLVEKEIKRANKDLQRTETDATGAKRGNYTFVTAESNTKIAKYATENAIIVSVRY